MSPSRTTTSRPWSKLAWTLLAVPRAVEWTKSAQRDWRAIDPSLGARIIEAVEAFAATGAGDVKKLTGRPGEFRLRVGDYRVVFDLPPGVVRVLRVAHRRDVYRR
jgi:mRNA interferase RelE/StbE